MFSFKLLIFGETYVESRTGKTDRFSSDTASDLRCANEVIEALRSGAADKDGAWGAMRQIDGIVYQNWLDFTQNWLRLICCLESL